MVGQRWILLLPGTNNQEIIYVKLPDCCRAKRPGVSLPDCRVWHRGKKKKKHGVGEVRFDQSLTSYFVSTANWVMRPYSLQSIKDLSHVM